MYMCSYSYGMIQITLDLCTCQTSLQCGFPLQPQQIHRISTDGAIYLGPDIRVPLPSCVVTRIRQTFPGIDYAGFKMANM